MPDAQIASIQNSLTEIKIYVARLDERAAAREKLMEVQSTRLDFLERKVSTLDKKIVGAMGGVTIIAYMLQLLVP
tara:strand:+ start:87 stop:311 length:225 start_codon:yes stop_codon:yes gene_type:complete